MDTPDSEPKPIADFETASQLDDKRFSRFELYNNPATWIPYYIHPTSTLKDYKIIERFIDKNPSRIPELPDIAFGALVLESNDPCDCKEKGCTKPHKRIWRSNLKAIKRHNKKHLITEFRIIAHGVSKKLLNIDTEMTKIEEDLGGPLPNVHKIFFTGQGLIHVGVEDTEASDADSESAAETICDVFPETADVTFHPNHKWGVTVGFEKLPSTVCKLFGLVFSACAHQLQTLQLHLTTPLTFSKFCEELVSLSINVQHIRRHRRLPQVPVRCLKILRLLHINGAIPWTLFEMADGQLVFPSLEEINFYFLVNSTNKISFSDAVHDAMFPAVHILRIGDAAGVCRDIFNYFASKRLSHLVIDENPSNFDSLDWSIIQNVKQLEVKHPTGELCEKCSSAMVQKLFSQPSSVTEATMIGIVYYSAPVNIKWHNLVSLELAVAIADKVTVGNMVAQLPRLEKLHISCRSMRRSEAKLTAYPDEENIPKGLRALPGVQHKYGYGFTPISRTLQQFHFYCHQSFDAHGFFQLLCHFPNVWTCSVNDEQVSEVRCLLDEQYLHSRYIEIKPYPEPAELEIE